MPHTCSDLHVFMIKSAYGTTQPVQEYFPKAPYDTSQLQHKMYYKWEMNLAEQAVFHIAVKYFLFNDMYLRYWQLMVVSFASPCAYAATFWARDRCLYENRWFGQVFWWLFYLCNIFWDLSFSWVALFRCAALLVAGVIVQDIL